MKEEINFEDFQKMDIRVGTVEVAEVPEWSHWVMKLTVNFGKKIGKKTIFAGIMKFYKPEDLQGKQFPFIVNLKPKKIGPKGDVSEGMMLMADMGEEEAPIMFKLDKKVPNGAIVR